MMMMALKLVRQSNRHKQDNIDDLVGYAGLLTELEEALKQRAAQKQSS